MHVPTFSLSESHSLIKFGNSEYVFSIRGNVDTVAKNLKVLAFYEKTFRIENQKSHLVSSSFPIFPL